MENTEIVKFADIEARDWMITVWNTALEDDACDIFVIAEEMAVYGLALDHL